MGRISRTASDRFDFPGHAVVLVKYHWIYRVLDSGEATAFIPNHTSENWYVYRYEYDAMTIEHDLWAS